MNRNLLFYWYIPSDGKYSKSYDMHLYCMNKYKDRFNSQCFILAIDDASKTILIEAAKKKISDIFPNASFQIVQNNPELRESIYMFYLLNELNKYHGNVFFGHSKGTTNNQIGNLYEWIYAMYYFNLEDINKVDSILGDDTEYMSYGTFKKIFDFKTFEIFHRFNFEINKYYWHYAGTFFWINPEKLYKYLISNNIRIDNRLHRWYAESVLGNLYKAKYAYSDSHDIPEHDLYNDCDYILKNIMLEDDQYKLFIDSYNETKKNLKL